MLLRVRLLLDLGGGGREEVELGSRGGGGGRGGAVAVLVVVVVDLVVFVVKCIDHGRGHGSRMPSAGQRAQERAHQRGSASHSRLLPTRHT